MRIQKITPVTNYSFIINNKKNEEPALSTTYSTNPMFGARVDKGLVRFYNANSERMPRTVKTYIESMSDKASKTPQEVQKLAFAALGGAVTIEAVKNLYPDDIELFKDIKDVNETKATRGILGVYRENKELLDICSQGILNTNENFTIWLLKKVFIEGKTLEEINTDFDKEVNPEFKSMYLNKENGDLPIRPSTLKALGIKLPEAEYMQSLRYTRSGYSDIIGEKISQTQREFWDSMPIEERTARARKSVEKFENWWNSMSRNEKLDIIAFQMDELEMLKKFNSSEIGKMRKSKKPVIIPEEKTKTNKIKIPSSLSRDDLFKIWAGNNLKLFEANLTELDKRNIEIRREQRRVEWWNSMSPEERTDYINKLKSGAEPLRYAMIDTWNNNPDILVELSHTMKKFHIEHPTDILYGTQEFNKNLSAIMKGFWETHPEFSKRMGIAIHEAHDKVKSAINSGRFELLKQEIMKARVQREKEISEQITKDIISIEEYNNYPDYIKEFIDTYDKYGEIDTKLLPAEYLRDFYFVISNDLSQNEVKSWIKLLKREALTKDDYNNIKSIQDSESITAATMNRALEATLADILYECTEDADVYLMSQSDCKVALQQIRNNKATITLNSLKTGRFFEIPVKNKNIKIKKIDQLYNEYKQPLNSQTLELICGAFFRFNPSIIDTREKQKDLQDFLAYYIKSYGTSARIIFGENNTYPVKVREAFAEKFLNNLPPEADRKSFRLLCQTAKAFERENQFSRINSKLRNKYSFLPKEALEMYIYEVNKALRITSQKDCDDFEKLCCNRKKTAYDTNNLIVMSRKGLNPINNIRFLCVEQALADILYKASGEEKVYLLRLEELLDTIEAINLIKKFPKDNTGILSMLLNQTIDLNIRKKPNIYNLNKLIKEYENELSNYMHECANEGKPVDIEEVMMTLNPEENKPDIDEYTLRRIKEAGLFNT